MIPEEKIQEVVDKADIVSVISQYTKVEKHGKDYMSLCLFHNDSNPSMNISRDKKIFKCFSCGVGGNVITFLQKYKHISFIEAVVILAEEYNVDLGSFKLQDKKETYSEEEKKLFKINEDAMIYYQALLQNKLGEEAKKYILNRNISNDYIFQWEIGFANNNELIQHLQKQNHSIKDIIDAGLATQRDDGVYDYFKNRVVFPLKNIDGHTIGFSGRILDDSKPKYLNTRETKIFKKSDLMYNIQNVWKNKERYDNFIILEGFMDVISLNKIDYKNSLALMGTALSDYHIKIIKSLKKPIKLFLDGDEPGINAMYKNAPKLIQNKIKFSIVDNYTTNDPDELVNSGKVKELKDMIDNSINPYEYFIKKWTKSNLTIDEKNDIVIKIIDLLKYESDLLTIDFILNKMSNEFGLDKNTLENVYSKAKQKALSIKNNNYVDVNNNIDNNVNNHFDILDDPMSFEENINNQIPLNNNANINTNYNEFIFQKPMQSKVFMSLVKSNDFIEDIEKNITIIYKNEMMWQNVMTVLISYYNMGYYDGNDSVKLSELLKKEDRIEYQKLGENLKEVLKKESLKIINLFDMTEKELQDIISKSKIDDLENDLNSLVNETKKIEKKILVEKDEHKKNILTSQTKRKNENHKIINYKKTSIKKEK